MPPTTTTLGVPLVPLPSLAHRYSNNSSSLFLFAFSLSDPLIFPNASVVDIPALPFFVLLYLAILSRACCLQCLISPLSFCGLLSSIASASRVSCFSAISSLFFSSLASSFWVLTTSPNCGSSSIGGALTLVIFSLRFSSYSCFSALSLTAISSPVSGSIIGSVNFLSLRLTGSPSAISSVRFGSLDISISGDIKLKPFLYRIVSNSALDILLSVVSTNIVSPSTSIVPLSKLIFSGEVFSISVNVCSILDLGKVLLFSSRTFLRFFILPLTVLCI